MKMWFKVLVPFTIVVSALGQDFATQCPSPNGYFADAVQCDKYYECVDDVLTEKLCPDGMGFNDLNPRVEKCDFLFQIDCTERPELQPAKATDVCPRQNGYFQFPEETNCRQFYYCAAGTGNLITCPEGLVFSLKTGTCVWPEEAGRTNCVSEKVVNFTCPKVGLDAAVAHPRYSDPDDCQYFYVCINGDTPRRNGCAFGQVFNSATKACDVPKEVPECADYYTEYFENYFATLGDDSGRISGDILAAAFASGFEVPQLGERQRIHSPANQKRKPTTSSRAQVTSAAPVRASAPEPARASDPEPASAPARPAPRTRPTRPKPVGGQTHRLGRPTTTTTPPPPPPADPVDDYNYYDEAPLYEDYPVDAEAAAPAPAPAPAPTPAPTEAPAPPPRRVPLRRTLVRARNE